jgi:hypothetical protein
MQGAEACYVDQGMTPSLADAYLFHGARVAAGRPSSVGPTIARLEKVMMQRIFLLVATILTTFAIGTPPASAEVHVLSVHLAPSGDPDGSGIATVRLNSEMDLVCYSAVVRNISAPTEPAPGVGSAHIHGPLPTTVIAIDLDTVFQETGNSTYIAKGCVDADSETIDAVLAHPELFYFNVHNAEHPAGAIQGSLG